MYRKSFILAIMSCFNCGQSLKHVLKHSKFQKYNDQVFSKNHEHSKNFS